MLVLFSSRRARSLPAQCYPIYLEHNDVVFFFVIRRFVFFFFFNGCFLVTRYLGDRRSFQRDVARPVRAALSSEGDGRATVEGLKELEKLHRQARGREEKISMYININVFFCFDFVVCIHACMRRGP